MCNCHPRTEREAEAWKKIRSLKPHECVETKDDWRFLHDAIEEYKRRLIARYLVSAGESKGGTRG
jgi:hypothetical protein